MKWRISSNEANTWIWCGVALIILYAVDRMFWVLAPTGLLNAYSSADGWQFPNVSKNLAVWLALATDILNMPAWYFEYRYFYAIPASVAWLWIAVIVALRKAYALRVLLLFSAFSIIYVIAIMRAAFYYGPSRDISVPWKAVAFYVLLAIIFTRPVVRAQYLQQRDA